jgi:Beta-lactamase enzyme family
MLKSIIATKKTSRVFALLLCGCFMLSNLAVPAFADTLSNSELEALNNWVNWVGETACSTGAPSTGPSTTLNLTTIAKKYNLQSAIAEQVGGTIVGSYNSNQPPATPASAMKLIIADVFLKSGLSLSQTVQVTSDVYYAGSNSLGVSTITLGDAMDKMLNVSDNVAANVLMKAMGGVSSFTQKAQAAGYTHTDVKGYYDPSNDGKNSRTIGDEAAAMNSIFTSTGSGYKEAQQDLEDASQGDNIYHVTDDANKWAGTTQVAGNVAKLNVSGTAYIIGVYINTSEADAIASGNIASATADIANAISSNNSPASSQDCSCNNNGPAVSGTISPQVGKGLPAQDQQNLQKAIVAGGNKWHVDPNFLAAIYYIENFQGGDSGGNDATGTPVGDGQWRDPAPPYGHGSAYSTSGTGAEGPFQFEPSTWTTYKQDGNGDGVDDPLDLDDAAMGAAKLMASLGAANTTDTNKLKQAAYHYNGRGPMAVTYSNDVISVYTHLSGGGQSAVSAAGCSKASCVSGSQTVSGNAAILCEAEKYQGIYYQWGGGHDYSTFRKQCPENSIASAASFSTIGDPGPCATDCSGLVTVAVDAVFNQNFTWDVAGIENDSKNWKEIPVNSVQAGDVVTVGSNTHVEVVDHYSSGTVYTFGSHAPGVKTGPATSSDSAWTGAYRYIGPGNST